MLSQVQISESLTITVKLSAPLIKLFTVLFMDDMLDKEMKKHEF